MIYSMHPDAYSSSGGRPVDPFADLGHVVRDAVARLRGVKFDTIVVSGMSGALVGAPVALRMRKRLAVVRKPGDSHHSSRRVDGAPGKAWIFLDDFLSTGDTRRRVQDVMKEEALLSKYVGYYEYARGHDKRGLFVPVNP